MLYMVSILNMILLETYVIGNQKCFRNLKNRCDTFIFIKYMHRLKITDYQNNDWQCSDYFMRYYFKCFTFISSLNPHNFIKYILLFSQVWEKVLSVIQYEEMESGFKSKPQTLCSWFLHFKGFWQHWKKFSQP